MADLPRHPDIDDDTGVRPGRDSTTGTPWGAYVFATVAILAVLLFVALHLTGAVGPGVH